MSVYSKIKYKGETIKNKHLKIGVEIKLLTPDQRKEVLSILKENNQAVDSKTEILESPKDLPYFGQYGKLNMWGAVSKDILFSSIKIEKPAIFITKIKGDIV